MNEKILSEKGAVKTGNPTLDAWVARMEQKTAPAPETSNPVADWIAGSRIVAYHVEFAKIVGSANGALFLSQMWFWSKTPTAMEREGWFWLTADEIHEQTGLTRSEQETARKRLRDMGILEEEKRGIPMKLWYRLDKERFYEIILAYLKGEE